MSTKLNDAVAAFTFSRLPREERIAKTLLAVLTTMNAVRKIDENSDQSDITQLVIPSLSGLDLFTIGRYLAPYAKKDFAVRFGYLKEENGKA